MLQSPQPRLVLCATSRLSKGLQWFEATAKPPKISLENSSKCFTVYHTVGKATQS